MKAEIADAKPRPVLGTVSLKQIRPLTDCARRLLADDCFPGYNGTTEYSLALKDSGELNLCLDSITNEQ